MLLLVVVEYLDIDAGRGYKGSSGGSVCMRSVLVAAFTQGGALTPAACQVVPLVSWSRSRSTTFSHPICAR